MSCNKDFLLPVNQKPGLKILVNQYGFDITRFFHGTFLPCVLWLLLFSFRFIPTVVPSKAVKARSSFHLLAVAVTRTTASSIVMRRTTSVPGSRAPGGGYHLLELLPCHALLSLRVNLNPNQPWNNKPWPTWVWDPSWMLSARLGTRPVSPPLLYITCRAPWRRTKPWLRHSPCRWVISHKRSLLAGEGNYSVVLL